MTHVSAHDGAPAMAIPVRSFAGAVRVLRASPGAPRMPGRAPRSLCPTPNSPSKMRVGGLCALRPPHLTRERGNRRHPVNGRCSLPHLAKQDGPIGVIDAAPKPAWEARRAASEPRG